MKQNVKTGYYNSSTEVKIIYQISALRNKIENDFCKNPYPALNKIKTLYKKLKEVKEERRHLEFISK